MSNNHRNQGLAHAQHLGTLFQAALQNNVQSFEATLTHLDDKNDLKDVRESKGRSCLHYAAQGGSVELCNILLDEYGCELDLQDKTGELEHVKGTYSADAMAPAAALTARQPSRRLPPPSLLLPHACMHACCPPPPPPPPANPTSFHPPPVACTQKTSIRACR